MKKSISIVLSLIIIFSTVSFAFAAADDDAPGIAVASDLHYNVPRENLEHDIDDDIYFYANRRAAMEDESGFIIDEFLRQCADNDDIQYVFISGDLADNGRTSLREHTDIAEKLKKFESETGKSVFVCNGNHDTGASADDITNEKFRDIYYEFGYNEALETQEGTLSYTVNIGNKYRLIVGDSCDPSVSTEDGLTFDRVTWICNQAKKAKSEGRYPLLMMHHNLLDHMPLQRILSHNFIVRNHELTAERFVDSGIRLVFTGHEHCSDVASFTSSLGNKIYDFSTTSLTMFPLSYRFVKLGNEEITYKECKINSIDYAGLYNTVEGYTDEQKKLMQADFADYSKGFFKAGIKYRLWLGLTPEKLGIDEDAFYADVVYTAVNGLLDVLETPYYGEQGLKYKAAEYNIDLPETGYINGWDLATELVAYHYAGDEPFAMDSPEVTLLLRTADYILLDVLSSVNDEVFLKAANDISSNFGTGSLCKDFTKAAAKVAGPVTAGEYMIVAIASPLLYGLAYDRDGIPDNNGSLKGYDSDDSGFTALSEKITTSVNRFFINLKLFFSYILKIFLPEC